MTYPAVAAPEAAASRGGLGSETASSLLATSRELSAATQLRASQSKREENQPQPSTSAVAETSDRSAQEARTSTGSMKAGPKKSKRRVRRFSTARKAGRRKTKLYLVRRILDERVEQGKLQYYIAWADDQETGEKFPPNWEPAEHVNSAAIEEWEVEKKKKDPSGEIEHVEDDQDDEHDDLSQNIAPETGSKRKLSTPARSHEGRSAKKIKVTVTPSSPAEWAELESTPSYPKVEVLVSVPSDFDVDEYQHVSVTPSSRFNSRPASQEPVKALDSQQTIPDSQEPTQSASAGSIPQTTSQAVVQTDQSLQLSSGCQSSREIPSRQPEGESQDFITFSLSSVVPAGPSTNYSTSEGRAGPSLPGSQPPPPEPSSQARSSPGFLTQPVYDDGYLGKTETETSPSRLLASSLRPNDADSFFHHSPFGQSTQMPSAQLVQSANSNDAQIFETSSASGSAGLGRLPQANGKQSSRAASTSSGAPSVYGTPEGEILPRSPSIPKTPPARRSSSRPSSAGLSTFSRMSEPSGKRRSCKEMLLEFTAQTWKPSSAEWDLEADVRAIEAASSKASAEPLALATGDQPGEAVGSSQDFSTANAATAGLMSPSRQNEAPVLSPAMVPTPQVRHASAQTPAVALPDPMASQAMSDFSPVPFTVAPLLNLTASQATSDISGLPATVAPADLLTQPVMPDSMSHFMPDSMPMDMDTVPDSLDQVLPGIEQPQQDMLGSPNSDAWSTDVVVTLPMASNTRQRYMDTVNENKATMMAYSEVFRQSLSANPDPELVKKMSEVFHKLLHLCDLPPYYDSLPPMAAEDLGKYVVDTNCKFAFVRELLGRIKHLNSRVLLLSADGYVFECLAAVAQPFPHAVFGLDVLQPLDSVGSPFNVIVANANQDLSKIPFTFDIVIEFDHRAREAQLPQSLKAAPTLVLSLVVAASIEHLAMKLPGELEEFEKQNALNVGLAEAQDILKKPPALRQPHDAARLFSDFIQDPDSGLGWEPYELPARILDFFLSDSQVVSGLEEQGANSQINNRKRIFDGDANDQLPKLVKRSQDWRAMEAHMSDLLKTTMAKYPADGQRGAPVVVVSLDQLEGMAAKIHALESELDAEKALKMKQKALIDSLGAEVQDHRQSWDNMQPKFMKALEDRGVFECQATKAKEEEDLANQRLSATKTRLDKDKEEIEALKAELATAREHLKCSTNPDVVRYHELKQELEKTKAELASAEARRKSSMSELDYTREAYQRVSGEEKEARERLLQLEAEQAKLKHRASENIRYIHEMNNKGQVQAMATLIDEKQALLSQRDAELERAREELARLRHGRRDDTGRQGSLPRSPRLATMSPRRGAATGGSASPAPNLDGATGGGLSSSYFGHTSGNSRFSHLKD